MEKLQGNDLELCSDHCDLFQKQSLASATVLGSKGPMLEPETFRNMMDKEGNSCTSIQRSLEIEYLVQHLFSEYSVLAQDLQALTVTMPSGAYLLVGGCRQPGIL